MNPEIGDIVHYVARGSADGHYKATCRAAIITDVNYPDVVTVGLCILNPEGL